MGADFKSTTLNATPLELEEIRLSIVSILFGSVTLTELEQAKLHTLGENLVLISCRIFCTESRGWRILPPGACPLRGGDARNRAVRDGSAYFGCASHSGALNAKFYKGADAPIGNFESVAPQIAMAGVFLEPRANQAIQVDGLGRGPPHSETDFAVVWGRASKS